ncbi:hypothetical protein EC973_001388 [Apophysomyces ossiformis]|uniref:sn-1-specific diacylglycerol lipase n=1 Tax=Apophysomyces ossiformis TaxID=679940 RepID=A0A8H7BU75_9FUNG|nr:hypothetical protein EC973_001388 [Apophysomyces ossiformis]
MSTAGQRHTSITPGRLRLKIINCLLHVPVKKPYLIITLGDQKYHVTISNHGECLQSEPCELIVTFHTQLFGTIQLDLYDSYLLLPDKHIGRTEIRLKSLEGMPETFTSYYEVWHKKLCTGASSVVGRRTAGVNNLGALQATISYVYQCMAQLQNDATTELGNPFDNLPQRLADMRALDSPAGSTNLLLQEQLETEFRRHLQFQRERKSAGVCLEKYEHEHMAYVEDHDYRAESDDDEDEEREEEDDDAYLARPLTVHRRRPNRVRDIDRNNDPSASSGRSLLPFNSPGSISNAHKPLRPSEPDRPINNTRAVKMTPKESQIDGSFDARIVGKDTSEILRTIKKMMTAFGQGFELSNLQVLAGFTVLDKFYGDLPRERSKSFMKDLSKIELASYFWNFSLASYGWKMLNFVGKGNGYLSDAMRSHSNALSVIEHLSIPKDDLLAYQFEPAEAFRQSYYIALDRRTNSIVLGIRGTMSTFDAMTDLVCEYEPWRGGLVHQGMKSSAMWFFRHVAPQLMAYCKEHSASALYIVGHSLGAATAAILTILLIDYLDEFRNETSKDFVLKCFGYAPACCLSLELSEKYKEYIQSFVFADDIVSKLSYGSMMDLKELIIASAEASKDLGTSQVLWKGDIDKEKWKKAFERVAECRRRSLDSMANPRLYVAGSVYQFWLQPTPNNPTRIVIEEANAKEVSKEIILQKSIIIDHLPHNFDVAFRRAREALMMEGAEKLSGTLDDNDRCETEPKAIERKMENYDKREEESRSPVADAIWDAVANLQLRDISRECGGESNLLESGVKR